MTVSFSGYPTKAQLSHNDDFYNNSNLISGGWREEAIGREGVEVFCLHKSERTLGKTF